MFKDTTNETPVFAAFRSSRLRSHPFVHRIRPNFTITCSWGPARFGRGRLKPKKRWSSRELVSRAPSLDAANESVHAIWRPVIVPRARDAWQRGIVQSLGDRRKRSGRNYDCGRDNSNIPRKCDPLNRILSPLLRAPNPRPLDNSQTQTLQQCPSREGSRATSIRAMVLRALAPRFERRCREVGPSEAETTEPGDVPECGEVSIAWFVVA